MRKTIFVLCIALIFMACASPPPPAPAPTPDPAPETPGVGPQVVVTIPELFSPDPDIEDDVMTIGIAVEHTAPIRNWSITVEPNRGQAQGARQGEQTERQGRRAQRDGGGGGGRQRGPFFEESGEGTPPAQWQWNGRGTSGEMVQSAIDYRFILVVNDTYDNSTTSQDLISIGIIVRREGDTLRKEVPSIVFPPNSANFDLLDEEDLRTNTRILALVARSLNRFEEYNITVEGHANPTTAPNTSARTTEEAGGRNVIGLRPLSEERATAVMNQLIAEHGIDGARLAAVGMGGTRTVAEWNDDEENWKNRRVEFILQR